MTLHKAAVLLYDNRKSTDSPASLLPAQTRHHVSASKHREMLATANRLSEVFRNAITNKGIDALVDSYNKTNKVCLFLLNHG